MGRGPMRGCAAAWIAAIYFPSCVHGAWPRTFATRIRRGTSRQWRAASGCSAPSLTRRRRRGCACKRRRTCSKARRLARSTRGAAGADQLGVADAPVYAPDEAGVVLWRLAQPYRFVFHEHWQTDLLGHHRALGEAVADLELFDAFLGGLLAAAELEETLIVCGERPRQRRGLQPQPAYAQPGTGSPDRRARRSAYARAGYAGGYRAGDLGLPGRRKEST